MLHTLSRAFQPNTDSPQQDFEGVNAIKFLLMSEERVLCIKDTMGQDYVKQKLKNVKLWELKDNKLQLPVVLTVYFSLTDKLSVTPLHG